MSGKNISSGLSQKINTQGRPSSNAAGNTRSQAGRNVSQFPQSSTRTEFFRRQGPDHAERSYAKHKASLVQCPKCRRSFFPHTIVYHELNCKAGKLSEHRFDTIAFRGAYIPNLQDRMNYNAEQNRRPRTQPERFETGFRPRQ